MAARSVRRGGTGAAEAFFPLAAAVLVAVGFFLPFWVIDIEGVRSDALNFSTDVRSSWPILGAALLAAVGSIDRVLGVGHGLASAAGALVTWWGMVLVLVGATEQVGLEFGYGSGAMVWIVGLLPAFAALALVGIEVSRSRSRLRAPSWTGPAIGLGGVIWVAAHLLPHDGRNPLEGPLLADIGRLGWAATLALSVTLGAVRRNPAWLALVVGQAAAWSLWWAGHQDDEALTFAFEPWTNPGLAGWGMVIAGTAAAAGLISSDLESARSAPEGQQRPMSFLALVSLGVIPLFGLAGAVS